MFQPSRFFASPLVSEGGGNPVWFAVVVSVVGALLAAPGSFVVARAFGAGGSLAERLAGALIATPLATLLFLLFWAFILHVSARLFGAKGDFGVGFRIMAYASALNVLQVIPGIGHLAMMFGYYLFAIAGLQGGYRLTPVKAAAALVVAMFVLGVVVFMLVGFVILALGMAGLSDWMNLLQQGHSLKGI